MKPPPRLPRRIQNARRAAPLLALVALSSLSAAPARAQRVDETLWGTDGEVLAIAVADRTIYVGGVFEKVGRTTGPAGVVDPLLGRLAHPTPRIEGDVKAAASDGAGGWFLGGDFQRVGGRPRTHLAHLRADGTLSSWSPRPDGVVRSLVVKGTTVYAAGLFRNVDGLPRTGLVALDAATGAVTPWEARPNGTVTALALHGNTLYLSGEFSVVGGKLRNRLAAVDTRTGQPTAFDPNADQEAAAIVVHGNTAFVAGPLKVIGGAPRNGLAALDATTGALLPWNPDARFANGPSGPMFDLAVRGGTVFVSGNFSAIGGRERSFVAAIDARTGHATDWEAAPGMVPSSSGVVRAIEVEGDAVYLGGNFQTLNGATRRFVGAVDAVTGALLEWDPGANQQVHVLASTPGSVLIAGLFSLVGGTPRRGLAALDAATGEPTSWDAGADGDVHTLLLDGSRLIVGGEFRRLGGRASRGLGVLDRATGAAAAEVPQVAGQVDALVRSGSTLYAGGWFPEIGGEPRNSLAAIDLRDLTLTSWAPQVTHTPLGRPRVPWLTALAVQESVLYLSGAFDSVGMAPRLGLAAVDTRTGQATGWPGAVGSVCDALLADGPLLHCGGWLRQRALDTGSGAFVWGANPNGSVSALALDGETLFAGGQFSRIGDQTRHDLARFGAANGALLEALPTVDGWAVSALAIEGTRLYLGGAFDVVGGVPRTNLAWIELQPTARSALTRAGAAADRSRFGLSLTNPARGTASVSFALPAAGPVRLSVFDLQGRRVATLLDRDPLAAGVHQREVSVSNWPPGVYLIRLEAAGRAETRRWTILR